MKRTYIRPHLTVMNTETELPIAASLLKGDSDKTIDDRAFLSNEREDWEVDIWDNPGIGR